MGARDTWLRRRLGLDVLADTDPRVLGALGILFGLKLADRFDTTAFAVLSPEIRDAFGIGDVGIAAIQVAAIPLVVLVGLPVAYYADRRPRNRMAVAGGLVLAIASLFTGLAPVVVALFVCRGFAGIGRAVNDPVHSGLISDYFPPDNRAGAFSAWNLANPLGAMIGASFAGAVAHFFGWRAVFLLMAVPVFCVIALSRRLFEPVRGKHERSLAGGDPDLIDVEEQPPSWDEAWRTLNGVYSLRRLFVAFPFLVGGLVGLEILLPLHLDDTFHVTELGRGIFAAGLEPFTVAGLIAGVPVSTRMLRTEPSKVFSLLGVTGAVAALAFVGIALAPNLPFAYASCAVATFVGAMLEPATLALASMVTPPRARSFSSGVFGLWILPGLVFVLIAAAVGEAHGLPAGLVFMAVVFLAGSIVASTAGRFVERDCEAVRQAALAQAENRRARDEGRAKLLLCRGVEVTYGQVQVLFGVDFEVDDGEIVALLGTNGAGKSTLLKAIAGVVDPSGGAIVFDGRDATHASPQQSLREGLVYMPGGKAVFPTLTVRQNLRTALWTGRTDPDADARIETVYERFPRLLERIDQPAGNLSGGEQQMLGLGMALLARPRLLIIDELSLGLAPKVVGELLDVLREIHAAGTTIVLVEQSVNVALTVAQRAVFLEKGRVRFEGRTADLLKRDDILRSVFLQGAAGRVGSTRQRVPSVDETTGPLLEVRDLSIHFGGIKAVNGVGFDVRPGEVLGFIGPNGAGKTTMFDLVSGYLRPDAGSIRLAGSDVTQAAAHERARLGLGRSFQDARLFPSMTVREAIAVAHDRHLRMRDPISALVALPDQRVEELLLDARVGELLEIVGLQAFADKFVSELSTGSRRIVDIACALAHEPSVLLLDEPSSGVAQRETEALGPVLRSVQEATGAALLVIEHDMPLISALSDRLVALDLGTVIAVGTPDEVLRDPVVVASYLGDDRAAIERSGSSASSRRRRTQPVKSLHTASNGTAP